MTANLAVNLKEDVVPYTTFRSSLSSFMDKARRTHRPILVTQNGKSASVLIDVSDFEEIAETLAVVNDVANGEAEYEAGLGEDESSLFDRAAEVCRP
ncbi:MAG: type II toxin-antitoxin system Phd/YefM family antitoxin [Kiritimatiellae bacterium]|nr:type II toxin-antitoxin system Phd/YefM family antitoxin [Kiritimatiellia bacterium]